MTRRPPPEGEVDWALMMRNAPKLADGICTPEDVAEMVAFLASDQARKVTARCSRSMGGNWPVDAADGEPTAVILAFKLPDVGRSAPDLITVARPAQHRRIAGCTRAVAVEDDMVRRQYMRAAGRHHSSPGFRG